jgi:hypothetical protein
MDTGNTNVGDEMTPEMILDLPMQSNDTDAVTIREYLIKLLHTLWSEGEGFSGKRPFGNSGWEYELYIALIKGGAVKGNFDEFGDIGDFDKPAAGAAIFSAINFLGEK